MTGSDNSTRAQAPSLGGIGPGHFCAFRCASCAGLFGSRIGSGKRRVNGVQQQVCPTCKTTIDKGRNV
jgi:hypothetical protein